MDWVEWQNRERQLRWKDKMKAGTLGGLVGSSQWPVGGTAMASQCTLRTVYTLIQ